MSLRSFLMVSLLVNLLLAGLVFGNLWRVALSPVQASSARIVAALPQDARQVFDTALAKTKTSVAPLRAQIDAKRHTALCILNADTFDKRAYLATTEKLYRLSNQLKQQMGDEVAAVAPQLPPAARLAFVDALRMPPTPSPDLVHDCAAVKEPS